MPKEQHYKIVQTALAAFLFFFSVLSSVSYAAGLGRLTTLSSLGQPLRAEVELVDVAPEELDSVKVSLAPVEAYRRSGIDYTAFLQSLTITVEQDADRKFASIRSTQAVNEPYIGLLLEIASGAERKGSEYAIVLDSVEWTNLRSAPLSSTASMESLSRQQQAAKRLSHLSLETGVSPSEVLGKPEEPVENAKQTTEAHIDSTYRVSRGDTLSKIAYRLGRNNVSLEQMLVVLYRHNPKAFFEDNMNLLKAGAVLSIPSAVQFAEVSHKDAAGVVKLHATDFREYSQKLAEAVQKSRPEVSPKTGSVSEGKITANVMEKPTPVNQSPDRLELSKAQAGGVTAEEKIAINKAIEDTNQRITELEKNVAELRGLLDVVSDKGKTLTKPAEKAVSDKQLEKEQKVVETQKADVTKATDDVAIKHPEKVTSGEKVGLDPNQTLATAKAKDSKKADKPEDEDDEAEAEEESSEDEEATEKDFVYNLKNNRIWHIAIGVGAALLILIVLVIRMNSKKPKPKPSRPVPPKRDLPPKEESQEYINPSVISGREFLDSLAGKEIKDEDGENSDNFYRPMTDDELELPHIVEEPILSDKNDLSEDSVDIPLESDEGEIVSEQEVLPEMSLSDLKEIKEDLSSEKELSDNGFLQVEDVADASVIQQFNNSDSVDKTKIDEEESLEKASLELNLSDIRLDLDEEAKESSQDIDFNLEKGSEIDDAEMAAKLELAFAYIDMKDKEGARELLEEVVERGTSQQVIEAKQALQNL